MHEGKLVFAQVTAHLLLTTFRRRGARYGGSHKVQELLVSRSILLYGLCAANLLRECARYRSVSAAQQNKLYHMGIRSLDSPSTMADANESRERLIYATFAQSLIAIAPRLYATEPFGVDLDNIASVLDGNTIDLCLSVFPWAPFRSTKAAIKLHTRLDLRGNIPTFMHISDGKLHDVNVRDLLLPEPGAFYIMGRGYIDFDRLFQLNEAKCCFVIRAKSNLKAQRRYSRLVDRGTGLICDQTVILTGVYSKQDFDTPLRRVRFKHPTTGKGLVFLTNNVILLALTITKLYRCRWQVELCFKWIKQHLHIKVFYGTTENSVKAQI